MKIVHICFIFQISESKTADVEFLYFVCTRLANKDDSVFLSAAQEVPAQRLDKTWSINDKYSDNSTLAKQYMLVISDLLACPRDLTRCGGRKLLMRLPVAT